jgi:antitoxin VapB
MYITNEKAMQYTRLSKHGYSQEVRIPRDYRLSGKRVKISRYGRGLLIEPVSEGFDDLLDSLELFSEDFLEERPEQLPFDTRA